MAEKKKSTVGKVTDAVQGAASAVVKAADEHVVQPVGKALGLTGKTKPAEGKKAEVKTEPAGAAPGKKSSAARVMTKSVAGKKSANSRVMSKRVADAKPTKKPVAGGGSKGPRRGASKGR